MAEPTEIPALPPLWEYAAPAAWRAIDFISDLHLAADMPRTFQAWCEHMLNTPADAVFILGDLFEVWVGDDSRHSGFEKECADVLSRSAASRMVAFMAGNRDFLVGSALLEAGGIDALPDPTVLIAFGRRTLLTHGDRLCLSDVDYQRFRAEVRSEGWRDDFLSRPLEDRRFVARHLRDASEQRKQMGTACEWPEVDFAAALRWMDESRTQAMVHGHTHRPGSEPIAPGRVRHVLSDWDLDSVDPNSRRAQVLRLTADGFSRLPPTGVRQQAT